MSTIDADNRLTEEIQEGEPLAAESPNGDGQASLEFVPKLKPETTPEPELTEEQKWLQQLSDLIAAGDCDAIMSAEAIEALAALLCMPDTRADGIRLQDRIGQLKGMTGRKANFKKLLELRINDFKVALANQFQPDYGIDDYKQFYRTYQDEDGNQHRIPISKFSAIITERIEYVGAEEQDPRFVLQASKYDHVAEEILTKTIMLTATEFDAMKWPVVKLDPGWDILPGPSNRDHVKFAIRVLSEHRTQKRKVYTHLGWIKLTRSEEDDASGGDWIYLHGGGAIGAAGPVAGIETDFGETDLGKYVLPPPPTDTDLVGCVRKIFEFSELNSEDRPNSPGLAAICGSLPWRAAFDVCPFSILFVGQSGAHKTTLAQLLLNHFCTAYTYGSRPSAPIVWTASEPILRRTLYTCKDSVLLIDDDYRTQRDDVAQKRVSMILQAQGNGRGRQTMSQVTHEVAPSYDPRGALISTHEDNITNYSSLGRTILVRLSKESATVNMQVVSKLQGYAKAGVFTATMAAYLQWMAGRRDQLLAQHFESFQQVYAGLAEKAKGAHERTPEILAELVLGCEYFLRFAESIGAITAAERVAKLRTVTLGLLSLVGEQVNEQAGADDCERFMQILHDLLATGDVYLEDDDGVAPAGFEAACGWHQEKSWDGKQKWVHNYNATRLGFKIGDDVYVVAGAATEQTQSYALRQRAELRPTSTIFATLLDRGVITGHRGKRDKHAKATGRKKIRGTDFYGLLHFSSTHFFG